jgi:hypothetical protein
MAYKNKEDAVEYRKRYYLENKECLNKEHKEQYKEYSVRPEVIKHKKKYRKERYARPEIKKQEKIRKRIHRQKPETKILIRAYEKEKLATDINFLLAKRLRSRINQVIRKGKGQKAGSAVGDLGCSIQHLKLHLELFFDEGMSWNNYGTGGWVIDHIKPLSYFDLTNREQFLEACNYKNLQPLWEIDNFRKNDSIQ